MTNDLTHQPAEPPATPITEEPPPTQDLTQPNTHPVQGENPVLDATNAFPKPTSLTPPGEPAPKPKSRSRKKASPSPASASSPDATAPPKPRRTSSRKKSTSPQPPPEQPSLPLENTPPPSQLDSTPSPSLTSAETAPAVQSPTPPIPSESPMESPPSAELPPTPHAEVAQPSVTYPAPDTSPSEIPVAPAEPSPNIFPTSSATSSDTSTSPPPETSLGEPQPVTSEIPQVEPEPVPSETQAEPLEPQPLPLQNVPTSTSQGSGTLLRRQRRFREWRHRFNRNYRTQNTNNFGASQTPTASEESSTDESSASAPNIYLPANDIYEEGLIEISGKGFGFLRDPSKNFTQTLNDTFVTPEVVRNYTLRDGMRIKGKIRIGPRGRQLYELVSIEGEPPDNFRNLPVFEELTVLNPLERIRLETTPDRFTTRTIDLIAPIGKGQRGLIVAPPRTGKTTILQHIAEAVLQNHPEIHVILLLVDERPEEVTELRRALPRAEVLASSNDSDTKTHTRISQFGIERARRLAEMGRDVIVLMDSLTRIGRAFNNIQSGKGRTMSGGVDSRALEIPRKLFASARNTAEAGSLTIIATALIETGSRMDELIFLEFKGTGNMELVLDRRIAEQRIYPAADIFLSGTRREELLLTADELQKISIIRRGLSGHKPIEAMERLLFFLKKYPTNRELLESIPANSR